MSGESRNLLRTGDGGGNIASLLVTGARLVCENKGGLTHEVYTTRAQDSGLSRANIIGNTVAKTKLRREKGKRDAETEGFFID